ncbi:class I SAM-dependent methyltransferase [Lysinibacillus sp. NPDC097231]|uniref:class I SAM-dependent methyltransferase n=1 Tax=Lysinibacillus sp. NPDC097231 TaxID=3364142 RepID=UPI003826BC2E
MEKGESSLTSLISAFSRAYHSQFDTPKIFDDYLAKDLITQKEFNDIQENMVQGIQFFNKEIAEKLKGNKEELLKWIVQIHLSPTPLARAAYCEKVLLNEIMLGLQQYVILGAGFDTFSLRHPEFESILKIFEIDHPATQEFKKKRLATANFELPRNLHFVAMDFTKRFSDQNLLDSGFDYKKTFFSLLGVSYYLTKEETSSLIDHLFANVPSGSSIVLDYADENLFKAQGISNRVDNMVKMAAASGEPMKSCFTYKEMEKMLEQSGLLIYEHLSPAIINELYFDNRKDYLKAFESIHYLHAVKK